MVTWWDGILIRKYRLMVIFHELAHLVNTFNDPELFYIMTKDDNFYYHNYQKGKYLGRGFFKTKIANLIRDGINAL